MNDRQINLRLGVLALGVCLLLVLFLIPNFVSSPSNVDKLILSPLFWPYALAGFTGLSGLGLLLIGWRAGAESGTPDGGAEPDKRSAAFVRLAIMAGLMIATMLVLHSLGLVLTAMLLFIAVAYLVQSRHKKTAWLCAILVPLALYAFFAHVAGISIPQGNFLLLP